MYDVQGDERRRLIQRKASERAGNLGSLAAVIGWLVAIAVHQSGAAIAFEIMAAVLGVTLIGTTVTLSRTN